MEWARRLRIWGFATARNVIHASATTFPAAKMIGHQRVAGVRFSWPGLGKRLGVSDPRRDGPD